MNILRRNGLILIPVLAVIILVAGINCSQWTGYRPSPSATNLLIISIDSLRVDHLGCYGYPRNTSPNIDAFSEKSVVFDNAYSPASWTQPAMASLFTSLNPRDHQIKNTGDILDEKYTLMAEHLLAHNYATAAFISHHLLAAKLGFAQGFTHFDDSVYTDRDSTEISSSAEITSLVIDSLRNRGPEPFLYWVHYFDPHSDYISHDDQYFGNRVIDAYDSEIAFTDHHLGRLFRELESLTLLKNTIVVIIADHGEEFNDHGGWYHGRTIYDELLHIPLIIYIPGCKPERNIDRISLIDLAPTLFPLIDIPVPETFKGETIPYKNRRFSSVPVRELFFETHDRGHWNGVRYGPWKAVNNLDDKTWSLYNTEYDSFEYAEMKDKHGEIFKTLQNSVEQYFSVNAKPAMKAHFNEEEIERLKSLGYLLNDQ